MDIAKINEGIKILEQAMEETKVAIDYCIEDLEFEDRMITKYKKQFVKHPIISSRVLIHAINDKKATLKALQFYNETITQFQNVLGKLYAELYNSTK